MSEKNVEFRGFDKKKWEKQMKKKWEEQDSKKTEQIPSKKLMEDTTKTEEKKIEEPKAEISQNIKATSKISTSNKPEDPKATKTCQKETSTTSTSMQSETPEVCEMPKTTTSKISTSDKSDNKEICEVSKITSEVTTKLEALEILETAKVCQKLKTTCEESTKLETSEIPEAEKVCQMPKTTSEESTKLEASEIPETAKVLKTTSEESSKLEAPEIPEAAKVCEMPETTETAETSTCTESEIPNVAEKSQTLENLQEAQTTSDETEERPSQPHCGKCWMCHSEANSRRIPAAEFHRLLKYRRGFLSPEDSSTATNITGKLNTIQDAKDNSKDFKSTSEGSTAANDPKQLDENFSKDTKSVDDAGKIVMIPVIEKIESARDMINARKIWPPISTPDFNERYLVLATHHLVPSLPIKVFEIFAEIIEVVTKKPVVLLHECRNKRPVATEVADIVILPAAETWKDGVLLPVSFVFEHHLNKDKSARVYADVIVAKDRAPHIQDIMDLRGHRCAIPDNHREFTAAELLFSYLSLKGENMIFFGNILDASTQLEVLEMVANKQAEVGVLESPAIRCNKYSVSGANSLHILTSLGPLPPYRIMIKEALEKELAEKLTTYLLNIDKYKEWLERLSPYGIIGFAKNSMNYYDPDDKKSVDTNVPYY